jgi:radical SAM family uncharacterized protein
MHPQTIEALLQRLLPGVQKPGRYTGGELNQVLNDWTSTPLRVALAFPDLYELGMSNLGLAILYDILNQQPDILAERAFAPWPDMEAAMRAAGMPLYTLESKHPLGEFDILGFSLPYETLYTNALNMLHLAGIPLRSAERSESDPLVIAGGHAAFNPEPMADFIDAFAIGEGEEVILEIAHVVARAKVERMPRQDLLRALAGLQGVYVPSLYHVYYSGHGAFSHIEALEPAARLPVLKRIVPRLPAPPTRPIVPYLDVTHNRFSVEIMRGCTRGCRFCHAGWINRPVRERSVPEILQAVEEGLRNTGYEEVGLLSLSSSDYSRILKLVRELGAKHADQHVNLSLPSLRIETLSLDLVEALHGSAHRGGFTLAPEAGTERMRQSINKPLESQQLLETAAEIFRRRWPTIKLYFMIGLPGETQQDVQAIADLCQAVLAEGRRTLGGRARVHASVGTFVPKPHTPYQWAACNTAEHIRAKQDLLQARLRGRGFKLNWVSPEETLLEAALSRGDRRLGTVLQEAWQRGAKFDAWQEHFNQRAWAEAFSAAGLDPAHFAQRERPVNEPLPWDHINVGVQKRLLVEEYERSKRGQTRPDCRQGCYACGILSAYAALRRQHPGEIWKCPEINPAEQAADGSRSSRVGSERQ